MMNCSRRSYAALLLLYPKPFRRRYAREMLGAFEHELSRVRSERSSLRLITAQSLFFADALVTIAREWIDHALRRAGFTSRLLRGSPGFTAALMTLAVTAIWACFRFAGRQGEGAGEMVTFAVAALQASTVWLVARCVMTSYRVARDSIGHFRYASVRRARIVAACARISVVLFVGAFAISAWHASSNPISAGLWSSPMYWLSLAATCAGVVCLYFALTVPLRLTSGRRTNRIH